MVFVIVSPFLPIFMTSFSIGTGKVLSFKLFSYLFSDEMIIIVRSIVKNYRNLFGYSTSNFMYVMCSNSIFTCALTMTPNFTMFFCLAYSRSIFFFFFYKYSRLDVILAVRLLITSFFLFIINYFHSVFP